LERVVYDLSHALLRNRSIATLAVACPSESQLPDGVEHIDLGPSKYVVQQDWADAEKKAYLVYERQVGEFDLIHDHSWFGFPYLTRSKHPRVKVMHTHHGHLAWKPLNSGEHLNLVAISRFMQDEYRRSGFSSKCVYNGIAIEQYPYSANRGNRLLYLGRITKFKQPHVAVEVAKKAEVPIDIIGGDRFVDDFDYVNYVRLRCDGYIARYLGELPNDLKIKYMLQSSALVLPSIFGEPFGLVAIEAMATGRPVICLDDGALSELVLHGVTGFVCKSIEEIISIIRDREYLEIRPEACRARAAQFSRENMANNYLRSYYDVLAGAEW
jgi:glycosyltransferase involved in cell wall biosynthesis